MLRNPAWRHSPIRTAARCAWSLVLKRFPPDRPLIVPFDEGHARIYADIGTGFGRFLYRFRDADPDLAFIRSLLRPGDVFIDGGAHVGMMSIVASRAVGPEGVVHAYEPNPATFANLSRNIELNRFANVVLHEEALGDRVGEAQFTVMDGDRAPWSHLGGDNEEVDARSVRVCMTALDQSVPHELWERVRLIKLDLEGAELYALRGAAALLEAVHPPILMEYVPGHLKSFGIDPEEPLTYLESRGYRILRHAAGAAAWEVCRRDDAMHLDRDSPNLLAVSDLDDLKAGGVDVRLR